MHRFRRLSLIPVFLFLIVLQLSASTYRIDSYNISITGRTRESVIRRHIGYDEGTEFQSVQDLEYAIERKRQKLLDLRIFKDVKASWDAKAEENGTVPVTINIAIDGAFSFIVFPSVSYDSNYGFLAQMYLEDQNFLGTTGKTKLSFAVRENDQKHDISIVDVNTYVSTDLPLGRYWNLFAQVYLMHNGKDAEKTTLTFDNTIGRTILENGYVMNIIKVTTNPESERRSSFRVIEDMSDTLEFTFSDNFTWDVGHEMSLSDDTEDKTEMNTYISSSLNLHKVLDLGFDLVPTVRLNLPNSDGSVQTPIADFILKSKGSLISWYGDFRKGYKFSIDAIARTNGELQMNGDIELFTTPTKWMELATRLIFRLANYPDIEQTELFTQHIRGVRNDNTLFQGQAIDSVVVLNLDAQFHLFRIPNIINVYIGPHVELGYVSPESFIACAGAEMLLILDEWPGAPGRITYSRNLTNPTEYEFSAFAYFFY